MPLTLEQKVDAFARFLRFGKRKRDPSAYTDKELYRQAGLFRQMAAWGPEIEDAELVQGIRTRLSAASAASSRARAAARQKAAAKMLARTTAQLKQELENPSLDFELKRD